MRIKTVLFAALFFAAAALPAFADDKSIEDFARMAVSAEPGIRTEGIEYLRNYRQAGLDAMMQVYAKEIERFAATGAGGEEWPRIASALDTIAMQKDAYASGLYWYTDLELAKAQAADQHKPILSLRLLGNLNEEFSCANSRFFRALLYSNPAIAKYLRDNYILHWKSVRPAPRVTIDFGDGRRIERTITGNSIHYILDERGAVVDALPGLYNPDSFLKYLTGAREFMQTPNANAALYRRQVFNRIIGARNAAVQTAKVKLTEPKDGTGASDVAPRAVTKMVTEASILTAMSDDFARFDPQIELDGWKKLAAVYAAGTRFDPASVAFIKRQNAKTGLTDAQFAGLLTNLESLVALDTTRNDFLFHPKLCEWLNQPRETDLEAFNSRVYTELFKTPESDKWLGLYDTSVYTALDGGGIVK
ncbi:MAG: hypothetical protein JSS81_10785 [Acidobacteria bacterium]|nr:hypothetical protein [Acidobacteriota bacterium]